MNELPHCDWTDLKPPHDAHTCNETARHTLIAQVHGVWLRFWLCNSHHRLWHKKNA
jgi:hypothetical protein